MPVGTQMYSLDTLLWALFAGVTIAVIYTTCMKAALGGFVRALIVAAAVDPLTAKSAEELGFGGKKAVIRSLRPGGSLGRCLGRHPEDETKFFIPREKAEMIERRFCDNGMTVWLLLLTLVLLLIVVFASSKLIPLLIGMF